MQIASRIGPKLAALLTLVALAALAIAPAALGADGEGTYGRTDDKVITFFCFGVMAFFAVLVIVLSLIQGKLDKRKDRRRSDLARLGRH